MAGPPPQLGRFRQIATALDARWRLPGTSLRFGWDLVIGLVPGLGDGIAGAIGAYGLYAAWRLGAPSAIVMRMLLNLALETVVGTVPIAGDLFDVGFKGNLRNLRLLERWLAEPDATHRRSRWLFVGIALSVFGILAAIGGIGVWLLYLLFTQVL
jgi:hypothetical protein